MATYTNDSALLQAVRDAIQTIAESGGATRIRIGEHSTEMDLAQLRQLEQELETKIARAGTGRGRAIARLRRAGSA